MVHTMAKPGQGSWGFGVLGVQLISQGAFLIIQQGAKGADWLPYAQSGLGVLALIAGILILIGK